MAKVMIVYGTTEGQTAKVASVIGEELTRQGHQVDLFDSGKIPRSVSPRDYDLVVAGGSVHMGVYQKSLRRWVQEHAPELNTLPSAFFSVCLSILQPGSELRRTEKRVAENFFRTTGWYPERQAIFGGALAYSKYGFFTRILMKSIARRSGNDTDTSRDYEYTDWDKVREFARALSLSESRPAKAAA